MRTKNKSKENKSKIRNILKIVFLLIIVGVAIVFLKKDKKVDEEKPRDCVQVDVKNHLYREQCLEEGRAITDKKVREY